MPDNPEVTLAPGGCGTDLQIAEQFGLKLATALDPKAWQLVRSAGNLTLRAPQDEGGYEVWVNVTEGPMARRVRTARRTDPLPRAVGMHRRRVERVVDATAGLGRDALVLAHLGCTVTALERVPALCALLHNAVEESEADVEVVRAEAAPWLRERAGTPEAPEVVYLDPMFPQRDKSAAVKKEMALLQALLGPEEDADVLLDWALAQDVARVVVKRPPRAPELGAVKPSHCISGKAVRYDVHVLRGLT